MSPRDPEERDEALRILSRLRDEWQNREGVPPEALSAIESLLGEYERNDRSKDQRAQGPGDPQID
jgi:hypothetical protein